ncbi:MAG: hypothetical protein ACI84C_000654 [Flavobacteriales bacterium]|jgi:hypothetical protein
MADWAVVYTTNAETHAELMRQMLVSNDILVLMLNKKDSLYHFGEIELSVKGENVIAARRLIEKAVE